MNIKKFIETTNLEKTALVGFYGGGNYGDELLLETLCIFFKQAGVQNVSIAYQNQQNYDTFHKEHGYKRITITDYKAFLSSLLKAKNIIIGGGGLWGMDVNRRILFLSVMLFMCRWILRKKVYLLGVGYYRSTHKLGHLSAYFAGKAANKIFARDKETFSNFRKITKHTFLDKDIAWYLDSAELQADYRADVALLENTLSITQKTFLVTLRRFRSSHKNQFTKEIEAAIANRPQTPFIVMIMEPKGVDPDNYKLMQQWAKKYTNIQIIDFSFNPVALLLFFAAHKDKLFYIGPQFHGIITAHLQGIPFFPMAYDNKVSELIKQIKPDQQIIAISDVHRAQLQRFIEQYEKG